MAVFYLDLTMTLVRGIFQMSALFTLYTVFLESSQLAAKGNEFVMPASLAGKLESPSNTLGILTLTSSIDTANSGY